MIMVLNMAAKVRSYDEFISQKASKTKRIQCKRCDGLLFFAVPSFGTKKHGITIKCKNCGYKNSL